MTQDVGSRDIGFRLYLITDRRLFDNDDSFLKAVEEALKSGLKAVQLREKDLSVRELLSMAYRMRELTMRYGARLFINDRLDVALSVEADGLHLGNAGMPAYAARKVAGPDMIIGASTHGMEEAIKAEEDGADFITLGPVYETPSKMRFGSPLGLHLIREVSEKITIPVLGIGGIKMHNVNAVTEAGAYGVALISGILASGNPRSAAGEFMRLLK